MGYFFKVLWGNLLLKKGPQDFAYSQGLMRRSLMVYFVSGLPGLMIHVGFEQAVIAMILDVITLILFIFICLQAFSKSERWVQSVICLSSIGAFFQVVSLPLLYSVDANANPNAVVQVTEEMLGLSILLLMFVSWNLAVYAHVFRKTFDIRLFPALLLTICYIVITVLARQLFFPELT